MAGMALFLGWVPAVAMAGFLAWFLFEGHKMEEEKRQEDSHS